MVVDVTYEQEFGGPLPYDYGFAVDLDDGQNAYVVGGTGSEQFPITEGAYDGELGRGTDDLFVVKLRTAGDADADGDGTPDAERQLRRGRERRPGRFGRRRPRVMRAIRTATGTVIATASTTVRTRPTRASWMPTATASATPVTRTGKPRPARLRTRRWQLWSRRAALAPGQARRPALVRARTGARPTRLCVTRQARPACKRSSPAAASGLRSSAASAATRSSCAS